MVTDRLTDEIGQGSSWTEKFADDSVMCCESGEQVEENLERRRYVVYRRGMKVSGIETRYQVCD